MSPDQERQRRSGRPKFLMASHSGWRPAACRRGRPTARHCSSRRLIKNQLMATEVTGSGQFSPPRLRSAVPYRYPAVSPDGKRVAYKSGGDLVIQQMDDGKVAKRFVLPQGNGLLGGWSPDSREFGFGGWNAGDPMPCIILDVETGLARRVASAGSPCPPGRRMGPKSPSISV